MDRLQQRAIRRQEATLTRTAKKLHACICYTPNPNACKPKRTLLFEETAGEGWIRIGDGHDAAEGVDFLDQMALTDAAQAVQISAYPNAYAKWEDEARAVLSGMSKGGGYTKPFAGSHPVGRNFSQHGRTGVDIPMPEGTPLRAVTIGKLTNHPFAFGSYGNWYILDANGFGFVYAQLSQDKAKSGMINPGEIIGYSGNTGNSFGPHLHFEARKNGQFSDQVDPSNLGIPGLRKGGRINYDNTIANLHRGETVLTSGLTDKFEKNIANAGGNEYNFDVTIENLSSDVDLERAFERFVVKHENRQAARSGRGRRI
jgi:hypothetical protein